MWLKRYDNQWSWVTAVINDEDKLSHLYLNGLEVDSKAGFGTPSPHSYKGKLKNYGKNDIFLGHSPSTPDKAGKFFKGDIARFYAWNRALTSQEVNNLHDNIPDSGKVIDVNFNNSNDTLNFYNVELKNEHIKIPNSIIPHRVEGKFRCLPHKDEGIVNGKFAKGETTARNEYRYIMKMQQDKIEYKKDGINQVKYSLVDEEKLTPWAKMLNIKL